MAMSRAGTCRSLDHARRHLDLLMMVSSWLSPCWTHRLDHRHNARLNRFGQGRPGVDDGGQVGVGCAGVLRATAGATAGGRGWRVASI